MTWLWVLPWALASAVAEVVVALIMRRYRCKQIINYLINAGIIRSPIYAIYVKLYTIDKYTDVPTIVIAAFVIYFRLYGNTIFLAIVITAPVLTAPSLPNTLTACVKNWHFKCRQYSQNWQPNG